MLGVICEIKLLNINYMVKKAGAGRKGYFNCKIHLCNPFIILAL